MIIRTATPADAAVVADFNSRLAFETENLKLDAETVRKGVQAALNDSAKGLYFVCEIDSVVAGQLFLTYEWSDWRNKNFWWIQSVYVKQEFRSKGVFRKLFEHVRSLAESSGEVCSLRLYVEHENVTAQKTYERLGMKQAHYHVFEIPVSHPPVS